MSDDATISNDAKPRPAHLFGPGNNANPAGRPKGSRNKLGEEFVQALQADFNQHGAEAIVKVRTDKPDAYLKVIASILPKELNVNTNALGDMSDDELTAVIAAMRALADTVAVATAGEGTAETGGREPAEAISPLH